LLLLLLFINIAPLFSFIPRSQRNRASNFRQAERIAAQSPNDQYSPETTVQLSQDFRSIYTTLREKGPVFKDYSPTIKFSFVTPPSQCKESQLNWSDDEVLMSDIDIMSKTNSSSSIFTKVSNRHGNDKPIAIYLPGLDGFGISAASFQFNDLSTTFELWRMSIDVNDRSSFHELVQKTVQFIEDITYNTNRPVYVIGESFGGMLTAAVALQVCNQQKKKENHEEINDTIGGIILVNSATSFDRSSWDTISPLLTTVGKLMEQPEPIQLGPFTLPSVYSVVGGLTLSAVIPSQRQYQQIFDTFMSMESIRDPSLITQTIKGFIDTFDITSNFLPPDLLEHRIKNWLMVGSSIVIDSRLKQLDIPSLIVFGGKDNLLSSKNEANRLTKILPQSEKLIVKEAGHFVLDGTVNLTEAILYSKIDPLKFTQNKKKYDPIIDWKLPSREEMDQTLKTSVKQLEGFFSPIWLSTNKDGKRSFGVGNVPNEGPILFVANHQLLGVDLSLLVAKLYKNGIPVRGLTHPIIFQGASSINVGVNSELGRVPGIESPLSGGGTQDFEKFGAVMVTPRNFYRLMQTGQNALLFPGGVREVFHRRNESYQLFWPEKVDFVRTAARFNATIVPVSAVGMADSFNFLLDSDELLDSPILGQRAKDFASNMTSARFDMDNDDELFLPPLVTPSLPSRNYFVFGKPIYTHDIDPKDKDACKETYLNIQENMKFDFHQILEAREKDAFKDAVPRFSFERLTGQQAPTFRIEEIDQA